MSTAGARSAGPFALILAMGIGVGIGAFAYALDVTGVLPIRRGSAVASAAPGQQAPPASDGAAAAADARPASSEGPAAGAPGPGASTCVARFFPEDTFSAEPPPLGFVCEGSDAVRAVGDLKVLVVKEGRGRKATGGMKEWAVMGMYDLAALAVMRGRCCANAAPLAVPASPASCDPLAEALGGVGRAAAPGAPAADLGAAVQRFDEDVRCIMRFRQTSQFGGYGPLEGGEATTFARITSRLPS